MKTPDTITNSRRLIHQVAGKARGPNWGTDPGLAKMTFCRVSARGHFWCTVNTQDIELKIVFSYSIYKFLQ